MFRVLLPPTVAMDFTTGIPPRDPGSVSEAKQIAASLEYLHHDFTASATTPGNSAFSRAIGAIWRHHRGQRGIEEGLRLPAQVTGSVSFACRSAARGRRPQQRLLGRHESDKPDTVTASSCSLTTALPFHQFLQSGYVTQYQLGSYRSVMIISQFESAMELSQTLRPRPRSRSRSSLNSLPCWTSPRL